MRKALAATCLALAALLVLAPAAGAAGPVTAKVGEVRLVDPPEGAALLIPLSYPIELAGRPVSLRVGVIDDGATVHTLRARVRANAGPLRTPERRKRFTFVHTLPVSAELAAQIRDGATVQVLSDSRADVDGDGKRDLGYRDTALRPLSLASGHRICGSVTHLRARPGQRIAVELPRCSGGTRWLVAKRPQGTLRISGGTLTYRAPQRFRGTASATLMAAPAAGTPASRETALALPVQITVGSARPPVVRALGDSVTAGFGYYEDGSLMSITRLFGCRPPVGKYDDACSSNSKVRNNTVKEVEFAADYGLSNNVSWVAQWANEHGATNFKNVAISGSRPQDWFGNGQFASMTKELESEDPDYVLLTIGANPILTETLFGIDNMGCAVWADIFGEYRACIERAFDKVDLAENLRGLYAELVKNTDAQIIAMQYHLSVPSSAIAYTAVQIAEMADLMNEEIAAAAAAVSNTRIDVVTPPHFNVGISLAPVYPAKYKCKGIFASSRVDGPSVQATPSQVFLRVAHPFEFCGGPVTGPPWVISGDTGIHPSAAGYAQMASQVPAPE
jgi:lysophospholipase L1-like esterase